MNTMTQDAILTFNAGSSSLKFALFALAEGLPCLLSGKVSEIGGTPRFVVHWASPGRDENRDLSPYADVEDAIAFVLNWLSQEARAWHIRGAAHRIVHGGTRFTRCTELGPASLETLRGFIPLAPLHQPHNLAAVVGLARLHPDMRQFGCFDTAFHASHDALATRFALPQTLFDCGLRRYGFHGLSYAWIARRLKEDFPFLSEGRVVAAHLGNGASLCAMKNGMSIDSTMGLTALDGLPMGTRCGALDPGAVLYMFKSLNMTADDIEHVLYYESGLKGLSGISNDVEILLNSDDPHARFALDFFSLKTAQQIAAMTIALGGLDAVVFTGGIGENAKAVRQAILGHLRCLQPFQTHVIAANEDRAMALEAQALI
jgi:acetate kinase